MNQHCAVCHIAVSTHDSDKRVKDGKIFHQHCLSNGKNHEKAQKPVMRVRNFFITKYPPAMR